MFWLALLILAPICPTITAQTKPLETNALEEPRSSLQTGPYIEHGPIYISGNDGFASWPGTGSKQDPYVIEGLSITVPEPCIYVVDTTTHFVIRGCILTCTSQGDSPLTLNNASNGVVRLCVFLHGGTGIIISSSANCTVEDCIMRENINGIYMLEADNCTLTGNTAYLNVQGFELVNTTDTLVVNNTCFRNQVTGISVSWYSRRNMLFLNSLGWNPNEGYPFANAKDDGSFNLWDDNVSKGNYWNDYAGTGSQLIQGSAASRDRYPSTLLDTDAPEVDHPDDVRFELGNTTPLLTWRARDRFPDSYVLYWDGFEMPLELWNGDDITIPLPIRQVGTYNCTLLVFDTTGNTAMDTVMVIVTFSVLSGLGTDLIAIASAVSVVLVIASILAVKASR